MHVAISALLVIRFMATSEAIKQKLIVPYFRLNQSSGTGQYDPVGSTSPSRGNLLGRPYLLLHLEAASCPLIFANAFIIHAFIFSFNQSKPNNKYIADSIQIPINAA